MESSVRTGNGAYDTASEYPPDQSASGIIFTENV